MEIKYVLFDCWDTVIYYRLKEENGNDKAVYKHLTAESKARCSFEQYKAACDDFFEHYYVNATFDVSSKAIIAYIAESMGLQLDCSYEQAEKDEADAYDPVLVDGLLEMLAFLKKHGLKCSVLSNTIHPGSETVRLIHEAFKKAGAECPFEQIISSSSYAVKKPDPLFFKLGAKKVGVPIQNIAFIGDNIYTDIKGAYDSGTIPFWLNWKKKEAPAEIASKASYCEIRSYKDLISTLEKEGTKYGL